MADCGENRGTNWATKAVEPEACEAAKLAARKAGLPLAVWLSQTILKAATEELRHRRNGTASAAPKEGFDSGHMPAGGNGSGPLLPTPSYEIVLDSIQRLASRIEEAEQHTVETLQPLAEKVSVLSQRLEEMSSRSTVSTAPMERALIRLTLRLQRLEAESGGKENSRRGIFSR